jgi:solute carrier family 25 (mitochondrial phosphate transporter), member 3
MSLLFPTSGALRHCFAPPSPFINRKPEPEVQHPLFPAYSAVDDAKAKTEEVAAKAGEKYTEASKTAQAKAGKIEMFSPKYYAACTIGGILACGTTHTAVTPLDLVKCRRQVDPKMYKGNFEAWGKIGRAEGLRGIFTGMIATHEMAPSRYTYIC